MKQSLLNTHSLMCLTFFSIGPGSAYIAFNRDEGASRPTLTAAQCPSPHLLYSLDQPSKGSWYCLNRKTGLLVLLTNLDWPLFEADPAVLYQSRGKLVLRLCEQTSQANSLLFLDRQLADHKFFGFNVVIADLSAGLAVYCNSVDKQQQPL